MLKWNTIMGAFSEYFALAPTLIYVAELSCKKIAGQKRIISSLFIDCHITAQSRNHVLLTNANVFSCPSIANLILISAFRACEKVEIILQYLSEINFVQRSKRFGKKQGYMDRLSCPSLSSFWQYCNRSVGLAFQYFPAREWKLQVSFLFPSS